MLIYEEIDPEGCVECSADYDVRDEAGVPYCAVCMDKMLARECRCQEHERGYRSDMDAASDREVR